MIPVVLVAVFSSVGMSGVPGGGYIGDYAVLFLVSRIVDGKDWLQKKMNRMSQSNNKI